LSKIQSDAEAVQQMAVARFPRAEASVILQRHRNFDARPGAVRSSCVLIVWIC